MTNKAPEDMSVDEIIQQLYADVDKIESSEEDWTEVHVIALCNYIVRLRETLLRLKMRDYTRLQLEALLERLETILKQVLT